MSVTIAVASLKGGVGKSTISLNLAACLHKAGHKVLLVDIDGQGTCLAWAAVAADLERPGAPVVGLIGRGLRRDLERVAAGFDVVLIDAPPRLGPETRAAMLAADLVVMPTTPGAADVWALRATLEVLTEARELRPELRAVVVMNRSERTTLSGLTRQAVAALGIPLLPVTLGHRVAFGEATLAGQGVVDYAPSGQAALEVEQLVEAVLAAVRGDDGQEDGSKPIPRLQHPDAAPSVGPPAKPGGPVRDRRRAAPGAGPPAGSGAPRTGASAARKPRAVKARRKA